jgi:hypothetical protein
MLKDKNERKNTRKKKDILSNNKPGDNSDGDYGEDFSDDDRKKRKRTNMNLKKIPILVRMIQIWQMIVMKRKKREEKKKRN